MAFTYEPPIDFSLAFIDGFAIDCLISDNHTFESEVTEFPVESGSTISDNIRPKPISIVMECLVSNTPLDNAGRFRKIGSVPTDDAYAMLQKIRADRRLVTISTSLQDYTNMAMESLSIPRASGRGDDLRFSATFKQVQLVTNIRGKRVAIPAAQDPSSKTFVPGIDTTSTNYVYMDVTNYTWYDDAIAAWRLSARLGTRRETLGRRVLDKDRPIDIPQKLWDNETVGQHTDAILRPRMLKLQGGTVRPFLYKKTLRAIIQLRPGQFVITGLVPQ